MLKETCSVDAGKVHRRVFLKGDKSMKPNRSSSRINLVAGSWLLMITFLALIPLNFLYASQADDKDLAQQDTMVQLPGNKPGNRLVHAKGIVCQG